MSKKAEKYSCIQNWVAFLWYERNITVLLGDRPEVRGCEIVWETRKEHCHPSQGFVSFEDGTITNTKGIANGKQLYLFDASRLRAWWRRRKLEAEIIRILEALPDSTLAQYLWNVERSADEECWTWLSWRCGLLERLAELIPNLGVVELVALLELLRAERIDPIAAAA